MRVRRLSALALTLLALLLMAGCSPTDAKDEPDSEAKRDAPEEPAATVQEEDLQEGDVEEEALELEEVEDSGITGEVRIEPADGDGVEVRVQLDGEEPGTHGIEVRLGSCAEALDPDAAGALLEGATSYTLADIEDGEMRDTAKLPDDIVKAGTYSLVVYEGEDVEGDLAACVDVEVE